MKRLYLVGGTMGVGKTTVCQSLKRMLSNSVFLDGDWCWDAHPFCVTDETKRMVLDNICYLLNNFIRCSAYDSVIFCWVMHEQNIIDDILSRLNMENCKVDTVSLMCDEENLIRRLEGDIFAGKREPDVIGRSVQRIKLYEKLNTVKIDTNGKSAEEIAQKLAAL